VRVIFFDIGDTLATPIFDEQDRLVGFNVFPDALEALEDLRPRPFRLGTISNPGGLVPEVVNRALDECGLLPFFEPTLIIYRKKDSAAVFADAAARAGVAPDQCVFVGENSGERRFASDAGMRVAPHPKLALSVAEGEALVFPRVSVPGATRL
jgi:FMN phosphatase YigB (HAD superfamily)